MQRWPLSGPIALLIAVGLAACAGPAPAQRDGGMPVPADLPDAAQFDASPDDPPARVGRVAEVQGQAYIYDAQDGDWRDADRNRPVTTGDRISTGADGRVELRVGTSVWRLGPGSELELLQLDDSHFRLQLHAGRLAVRVRSRLAAAETEVLTGEGRFLPQVAGHYRIDRGDDTSTAGVWSGELRYESPGDQAQAQAQALTLGAGESRRFWLEAGPGTPARFETLHGTRDDFANWVLAAEARDERSAATRYVSPEMTGAEDLDRYGRWDTRSDYGPVWMPDTVASGWAPYRYGRWAWVSPWGWTWVDDAPWGFAPFHYGRWVQLGGRWGWAPGPYAARPVYAPALVAWVGGPQVSVSIGIGGPPAVGWFPLGPREVYVPGYRYSPRYLYVVNGPRLPRDQVRRIVRDPDDYLMGAPYRYRGHRDAETRVPGQVLLDRRPVAPAWQRGLEPGQVRDFDRPRVTPVPALPRPAGAPGRAPLRGDGPWPVRGDDGRPVQRPGGGDDVRTPRPGRLDDGRITPVPAPPAIRPTSPRDAGGPGDTRPAIGRPGAAPGGRTPDVARPEPRREPRPVSIEPDPRVGERPAPRAPVTRPDWSPPGRPDRVEPRPAPAPRVAPPAAVNPRPPMSTQERPQPWRELRTQPSGGEGRGAAPAPQRPQVIQRAPPAPAPRPEPRQERGGRPGGPGSELR